MAEAPEERSPAVWVSRIATSGKPRLTLNECPVSYVTGESVALVQEFRAWKTFGSVGDVRLWPAKRVDGFSVLLAEAAKMKREENAE